MKDLFVPYKIAKQLKEKGFNEPCLTAYIVERKELLSIFDSDDGFLKNTDLIEGRYSAPLYQQVIDWFREKHEILIWIGYYPPDNAFRALLCEKYKISMDTKIKFDIDYNTALNKIFQEALNLI